MLFLFYYCYLLGHAPSGRAIRSFAFAHPFGSIPVGLPATIPHAFTLFNKLANSACYYLY